jgi:hypothetical protein
MKIVQITADIYSSVNNVVYRLYVDNDLMTERTFIWPIWKNYIEEHIVLQVEEDVPHCIRVESIRTPDCIIIKNITVNGVPANETFTVTSY